MSKLFEVYKKQAAPIIESLLDNNCVDCAIDQTLAALVEGLDLMSLDARQRVIATILSNYNLDGTKI